MTNRFCHKTRDRREHNNMWSLRHTHAIYSKDSVVQTDLEAVTAAVCEPEEQRNAVIRQNGTRGRLEKMII